MNEATDSRRGGTFETTHWSLVEQARDGSPSVRRETLGELLTRYLPPLRIHLLACRRLSPDETDDLLQSFITEKILERDLLSHVDRAKGKFRSFLLSSLDHYRIDHLRSQQARRRRGEANASLDADGAPEPVDGTAVNDIFELAWARQVLSETLQRMRSDCLSQNRSMIWDVFEARLLQPALTGREPVAYGRLVERFQFASPAQATNSLITARRQFLRTLEKLLTEYGIESEHLAEEIGSMATLLQHAGPLELALDRDSAAELALNEVSASGRSADEHQRVESGRLACLLENSTVFGTEWNQRELPSVLEHLLSSDLGLLDPKAHPVTIRELLFGSTVDVEQLRRLKSYAKKATGGATPELPGEVASVLYYASICAARVCSDHWITTSSDEVILMGLQIALRSDWLPKTFVDLFTSTAHLLTSETSGNETVQA